MVIEMNKRNEKISAFLDNGMHSDELMSFSLSSEADDAKVAQRYQMVGDALRGELSESSFIDVSQAVRDALANENIATEMSAELATDNQSASIENKTDNKKSSTGFFDWSSLFRPAAGVAMAAFVAVVMVFSLSGNDEASNSVAVQETDSNNESVVAAQPAPVDRSQEQSQEQFRTVANSPNVQPAQINTLLNPANTGVNKATQMSPYINQHLEFARQDTLQGRMPYVRAVSFENKKR